MDWLEGIVLEGGGCAWMMISELLFCRLNIVCIASGALVSVGMSPCDS